MSDKIKSKPIGLISCIGILVGGMIGSAIFSLTGLTIFNAGPASLLSWVLAAVIMLCYGLIIAELATIFPESGGVLIFPTKALGKKESTGKLWGWISTWGFINSNIVAIAFSAIYIGIYLGVGFPFFENTQVPVAIISIIIVFLLNITKFSVTEKINSMLVIGLIITLLIYVSIALFGGNWDINTLNPFFSQGLQGEKGFFTSIPIAMVGYGSIVTIAFMVSEVKKPKKNVPKSVIISMSIVSFIYFLVVLATVGLISANYLIDNPEMQFIPLYAAAFIKLIAIPWIPKLISISAVLALFTTMIVLMAMTARTIEASANQNVLPKKLLKKSKHGIPIYATIIVAVFSIIISFFPELTSKIVELAALFSALTIIINCISYISAHKKHKYKEYDFKIKGGIFLSVFIMIIITLCYIPDIIQGGLQIWIYTICWYSIGLLIYKFSKSSKNNNSIDFKK